MTLPCAVMCDLMQYQIRLNEYAKFRRSMIGLGKGIGESKPLPRDSTSGVNGCQESGPESKITTK